MKQPELFMQREDQGGRWHFSLHASGQWHIKRDGEVVAPWYWPPEMAPGYTRAVGIV